MDGKHWVRSEPSGDVFVANKACIVGVGGKIGVPKLIIGG